MKTYEIVSNAGTFRMDVPDEWKVTYGPVSPGGKYGGGDNALRVYESDTKQRAIFLGVQSFRDLSIPMRQLLVRETGSAEWSADTAGRRSRSSVEYERQWVDAGEQFPALPESDPF